MRVGVVGCGPIADSYVTAARRFPNLHLIACAGQGPDSPSARTLAERHGLQAVGYDAMLADDRIDVVLVLTPAHAHVEPVMRAIAAGKHVYCEKPLASSLADSRALVAAAASHGVSIGCAPDTVLGANIQRGAALLESGAVGRIVSGVAAIGSRGMEHWHPDPAHFYQPGGGPILDKGPYHVAALVTLLGPVEMVRAEGRRAVEERVISAPTSPKRGERFAVDVPTSVQATLRFRSGALVTLIASWDMPGHSLPDIELYGVTGAVRLADPNWFGDALHCHVGGQWQRHETDADPLGIVTMTDVTGTPRADHRGIGLAEMVDAVEQGRIPLCSGAFALHVIEILTAILTSLETGTAEAVTEPIPGFVLPRLDAARAARLAGMQH